MEITIERLGPYAPYTRRGRSGTPLPSARWDYRAIGPDGKQYQNTSLVELRGLLKRRYPGVKLVEPWKVKP